MALNGYRDKQDRASRLVKVRDRLVTVVRTQPHRYEVYSEGQKMGEVFMVRTRWDWIGDGIHRLWRDMCSTRQVALEELMAAKKLDAAVKQARAAQQAG